MVDEQNVVETPDEKRRRLGRERTRRHRQKNRVEEPPESFDQISALWEKHDQQLQRSDPKLHARLLARHEEVTGLEAEVTEILKGVGIYTWPHSPMKRAETLDANTPNPDEIFPMPDICYAEVRQHVQKFGSSNWRAVESACIRGETLDDIEEYYKRYGFRLRLSQETLQSAREALVLYALTTKDPNIDPEILAGAISDCVSFKAFSGNAAELGKLIEQHREASVSLQNL